MVAAASWTEYKDSQIGGVTKERVHKKIGWATGTYEFKAASQGTQGSRTRAYTGYHVTASGE